MRDFVGVNKAQKLAFLSLFANNGEALAVQMGLTTETFGTFSTAVENAITAQADADTAQTAASQGTIDANGQIQGLIDQVRGLCNALRANKTVTDAQLAGVGIARATGARSPIAPPDVAPALALASQSPGSAVFTYSTPGSSGPRERPEGAVAVEISLRAAASEADPEAGVIQRVTRTPAIIRTSDIAGRVKVCARFVTQRGLVGPWSDPIEFNPQTA